MAESNGKMSHLAVVSKEAMAGDNADEEAAVLCSFRTTCNWSTFKFRTSGLEVDLGIPPSQSHYQSCCCH